VTIILSQQDLAVFCTCCKERVRAVKKTYKNFQEKGETIETLNMFRWACLCDTVTIMSWGHHARQKITLVDRDRQDSLKTSATCCNKTTLTRRKMEHKWLTASFFFRKSVQTTMASGNCLFIKIYPQLPNFCSQISYWVQSFFTARCYASAVLAMALCPSVCLSVCLSVCPSQVGVLLKRLNGGSHKQHHTIVQGL